MKIFKQKNQRSMEELRQKLLSKPKNDEVLDNAEETMLLFFQNNDYAYGVTYLICDIATIIKKDKGQLKAGFNCTIPQIKIGDYITFVATYTNDPTPKLANHVISLGYGTLRLSIYKAQVICKEPFMLEFEMHTKHHDGTMIKNMDKVLNRPQRPLYCSEEDKIINAILPVINNHFMDNEERLIKQAMGMMNKIKSIERKHDSQAESIPPIN